MDIESKRYRVRSMAFGGYEIEDKASGRCAVVDSVPSSHALALMHESTFDSTMRELML